MNWARRTGSSALMMVAVGIAAIATATSADAAIRYVDGGCSVNGNGSLVTCAASTGGAGAFNSLQSGLNALSAGGDILNVRGVHGTFDGRYSADSFSISGKNGASGNPIIVRSFNLGTPSQETVYIESTRSANWTKCDSTTCPGAASVNETWFTVKSGDGSNRAYFAQKPDGSITPRKSSLANLTSQYDAYSCEGCNTLYVRWGTSLPTTKPYINYANNGNGFVVDNSSYVTIRGFVIRATIRAGAQINYPNTGITIDKNKFFYINDSANGSARPVTAESSTNVAITNNEFAYSSSEPLHLGTGASGHMSGIISGNWIHDIGDRTVLGPATGGTPNCTTFTSDAPQPGNTLGDFSGLIVERNLFERCYDNTAILFESHCDGLTVRDNLIRQVPLAFKFSPDNGGSSNHTNNNKIYNNLIYGFVSGSHNGAGNCFLLTGSSPIQGNVAWNNTCAGILNLGVESQSGSAISGNKFYNNVFTRSGSGSLVNSVQAAIFQNNLLWNGSSSGSFGSIGGSSASCGANGNRCGDPLFVNAAGGDYHIKSGSPAIDGATAAGLPVGRTKDVCNSVSYLAGLYTDCQTLSGSWDIGFDEFGTGVLVPTASLTLSDSSPLAAGSIIVTLTTTPSVVNVPSILTFTGSDGTQKTVTLAGSAPGSTFTGVFVVDSSVAEGVGTFSLPTGALVTSGGASGNSIIAINGVPGSTVVIDRFPPATPKNLRFGS